MDENKLGLSDADQEQLQKGLEVMTRTLGVVYAQSIAQGLPEMLAFAPVMKFYEVHFTGKKPE